MNSGFEIKTTKKPTNRGGSISLFSTERKKEIVMSILNRPKTMTLDDACMIFGISNPTYYEWKKMYGCSKVEIPVKKRLCELTTEEKIDLINKVDNRPNNVLKTVMFKRLGLGKGGLYYVWKKEFGMDDSPNVNPIVNPNVPMNVKVGKKSMTHTVTLKVEVDSLTELIGLCNHIGQLPKVKTILSVE